MSKDELQKSGLEDVAKALGKNNTDAMQLVSVSYYRIYSWRYYFIIIYLYDF